jgi:hypothetical protein
VASGFTVHSSTSITVKSANEAPLANASVDVTVTSPGGTSAVSPADVFTYGHSITTLSPSSGPVTGGTTVTITGSGLTGASGVLFGSTPSTQFTVVSDTQIKVTSPADTDGNGGLDRLTIIFSDGSSVITGSAQGFTYFTPVPVVTSVSPNMGAPGGGDTVTIKGIGLTGATTVSFGATPVTSGGFTVNSAGTQITVTSPPGTAPSTVDVTVTGPGGTSVLRSSDTFTYGPVITYLSPNSGSHLGGTLVTIKGAGFSGASAVNFGTTAVPISASSVNTSGTQITVTAPPGSPGASVEITVSVGGGHSNELEQWTFVYG